MHQELKIRSRKNLDASIQAAKWTSLLSEGLKQQARQVGYEGRLSEDCLDELQTFLTGLLETQHVELQRDLGDRHACRQFAQEIRTRRDALTKEVYGQLVEVRSLVRSLIGKKLEAKLFGRGQKTPREPRELARVATGVVEVLRNPRARDSICRGLANEELWDAVVTKMDGSLAGLWTVLHELSTMENEERAALKRFHRSKDRLQQTQKHLFRLQESLLALAGREDLVKDVRPTERTHRKTKRSVQTVEKTASNASGTLPETSPTSVNASGAVPKDVESLEPAASRGTSTEFPSDKESHPVRKVLQWLQTVPHRVRDVPETPETTASEVQAA